MFRPDIPGKHRECSNNPAGKLRMALKMDFISLCSFVNLLRSDRGPLFSQWDVWGKTTILFSFSLPERRMEEGVGPELYPM